MSLLSGFARNPTTLWIPPPHTHKIKRTWRFTACTFLPTWPDIFTHYSREFDTAKKAFVEPTTETRSTSSHQLFPRSISIMLDFVGTKWWMRKHSTKNMRFMLCFFLIYSFQPGGCAPFNECVCASSITIIAPSPPISNSVKSHHRAYILRSTKTHKRLGAQ